METIVVNKLSDANTKTLVEYYNTLINEVKEKINKKTYNGESIYHLTGDIEELTENDLIQSNNYGIQMHRRFKRYLKQAMNKKSISSINKLLNLVYKIILGKNSSPKIICDKHEKIQKLRKKWKQQQLIADSLLNEYKKEKSDFYKMDYRF